MICGQQMELENGKLLYGKSEEKFCQTTFAGSFIVFPSTSTDFVSFSYMNFRKKCHWNRISKLMNLFSDYFS